MSSFLTTSVRVVFFSLLVATATTRAGFAADLSVRVAGAVGDGVALETVAIQKAIDRCSEQGGGKVVFPAGRYLSGTLLLKNNVTLHLDEGATILGSTNIADYQAVEPFTEGTGQQMGWCLIGALEAKNIGIEGPGTIDGQGREFNAARTRSEKGKRPVLLRLVRCEGVSLSQLRLRSSAMWMVHLAQSKQVRVDGVSIVNHVAGNNDGFDIDSCDGVQLTNCDVDSGDDALCLKSTRPTPSRNIVVSDCTLKSDCSAIKFGTESLGGFENVSISRCHVLKSGFGGINIFTVDGGLVRNINISDISMDKVSMAIFLRLGARLKTFHPGDTPKPVGSIQNISIKNVRATTSTIAGIMMTGVPGHRIEGVTLENIDIGVPGGGQAEDALKVLPEKEAAYPECIMFGRTLPAYGVLLRHVQNVQIRNCVIKTVEPDARPLRWNDDAVDVRWTP